MRSSALIPRRRRAAPLNRLADELKPCSVWASCASAPAAAPETKRAAGRFFITSHAVHKYQREVRPNASYNAALSELIRLTSEGRFVAPYNGHTIAANFPGKTVELWRGPVVGTRSMQAANSRMRFVVVYGPGELPQVVTVLPKGR
jgi:hypothetical protein